MKLVIAWTAGMVGAVGANVFAGVDTDIVMVAGINWGIAWAVGAFCARRLA